MPKFLPDVKEFDNLTTKSGLSKKSWNFWKKMEFLGKISEKNPRKCESFRENFCEKSEILKKIRKVGKIFAENRKNRKNGKCLMERKSLWKRGKCEKFVEICGKREKSVKKFLWKCRNFRENFLSALYISFFLFFIFFFFSFFFLKFKHYKVLILPFYQVRRHKFSN